MNLQIITTPQIHLVQIPDSHNLNRQLLNRFKVLQGQQETQRSHFFQGRFENIYIERQHIPEILSLITTVENIAKIILKSNAPLRCGYWFNWMQPGHSTSLHTHEENDELLSAVYYVTAPDQSGDLLIGNDPYTLRYRPVPGMLALFSPQLPHAVAVNASDQERLSIAFNIGLAS